MISLIHTIWPLNAKSQVHGKKRHLLNLKAIHKNTRQKVMDPPNCPPPSPLQETSHEDPCSRYTFFKLKRPRRDTSKWASKNKGKGAAAPEAAAAGCSFIVALSLCPLGYTEFPGKAGAGPRGMHPSPNLGGHQHAAGWLLPAWKGQTAA